MKRIITEYVDVLCVAGLSVFFILVYCVRLYTVPYQVNTDEITIMLVMQKLIEDGASWFGLSYYFGFPSFIFITLGHIAQFLGGIDLYHVRLVHSVFGVAIVLVSYGFFRLFFSWPKALALTVLLGVNHSLLGISRMAMRDNTGLFFELLALIPLMFGYKTNSKTWSFIGGLFAGLTFYTYFPSRITIVIWGGFLLVSLLLRFSKKTVMQTLQILGATALGFLLVAGPILFATVHGDTNVLAYSRQQFLFYPEGQKLQQDWVPGASVREAVLVNIKNGLTTFNNHVHDYGYIYPNYGHGFVDPITGVLLWVGVLIIVIWLVRRTANTGDVLALVGFFVLYTSFAFLITKAPNYTRLLVTLPFVVYLAGVGLFGIIDIVARLLKRVSVAPGLVTGALTTSSIIMIASLNGYMFNDFVQKGFAQGNDVGGTARFIEAQKNRPGHLWLLAANTTNMYYSWGEAWQWESWLGFFTGPGQQTVVIDPQELGTRYFDPNTTIFMNSSVWDSYQSWFRAYHPLHTVTLITPDGRLLAVEIR